MAKKNKNRGVGNRNAAWKSMIDSRAASGGQLGLSYLQGLASQYGVPYSQIVGFVNKSGYQLGTKAAAASQPAPSAPTFNPGSYDKLKISDVSNLQNYLNRQLPFEDQKQGGYGEPLKFNGRTIPQLNQTDFGAKAGFRGNPKDVKGYRMLADYMGVNKINSKKEINKALSILGGASSPFAQALSTQRGIKKYDSVNDYLATLGGGIGTASVSSAAQQGGASGGSGMMDDSYSFTPEEIEDPAPPQYSPGGAGSALDGGATGMRTRRSKWRTAGKTKKGTANLKITGQTGASSGLNLGM